MAKIARIPSCHPDRKHYAHGLCLSCRRADPAYKELQSLRSKKHYAINKDRIKTRFKRWYADNKKRVMKTNEKWLHKNLDRYLLRNAKARAKKYNLEFNLDLSDIQIPEYCPVLHLKLTPWSAKHCPTSPSLDRIDNSKGYIKGNVLVVSYRANVLKNDASVNELRQLYEFYNSLQSQDGNTTPVRG